MEVGAMTKSNFMRKFEARHILEAVARLADPADDCDLDRLCPGLAYLFD
jgi:hypothetical protein